MNRFTAGPWTTDPSQSFYVKAPDGTVICNANTQANQELIREAPEMARALEAAKVALGAAIMIADAQAADAARRATRDANNMHTVNVHLEAKGRWEKLAAEWTIARDDAAAVLVNAVGEG